MSKSISFTPRFDNAMKVMEMNAETDIWSFMQELSAKLETPNIIEIYEAIGVLLYDVTGDPKANFRRVDPLTEEELRLIAESDPDRQYDGNVEYLTIDEIKKKYGNI